MRASAIVGRTAGSLQVGRVQRVQFTVGSNHLWLWLAAADRSALRPCLNGIAPAAICGIGEMDRHFKPIEPTAVRVTFSGPLSTHVFDPIFAPQPNAASPLKDFIALAADATDEGFNSLGQVGNLPNKKGPPTIAPPRPIWTGLYVGLNAGVSYGADNKVYYSNSPIAAGFDPEGRARNRRLRQ